MISFVSSVLFLPFAFTLWLLTGFRSPSLLFPPFPPLFFPFIVFFFTFFQSFFDMLMYILFFQIKSKKKKNRFVQILQHFPLLFLFVFLITLRPKLVETTHNQQ